MRKAEFYVPTEVTEEFSDEMVGRKLTGIITGTSTDGEIVIEIDYEKSQTNAVDELEKILDHLIERLEEEQEEEEENEEDEDDK